jgi:hypothetical protein
MNVYFSELLVKEISSSCKLIFNKNDKTKYTMKLLSVRCPFGPEEFNGKVYLNIELKKDNPDHQTMAKDIKLIETYLLKDSSLEKSTNIKNDTLFKVTIPQINKKIITKTYQNQKEVNIYDIKGKTCDIIVEINTVWEFNKKVGVQFVAKTINILN